jgi:anti-sigma factor RsiW
MSLALDGRLDASGQEQLRAHVQACPTCGAEWEAMQAVAALLEGAEMIGPPLGFATRVERQLEERSRKHRRLFSGVALATGSLSLAGITLAAVLAVAAAVVAWLWLGPSPAMQEGSVAVSQVASGVGLMGKGASLFLKDLLLRYGVPALVLLGMAVAVLGGAWVYMYIRRPGNHSHNGYV